MKSDAHIINDMGKLVYTGNGILDQLKVDIVPSWAEHTVFMPYEVGEYSIFIKEDLEGIIEVGIYNDAHTQFRTEEIVSSSEGSILYFKEKLQGIFAGFIYRGWTLKTFDYKEVMSKLLEEGKISLSEYLGNYL